MGDAKSRLVGHEGLAAQRCERQFVFGLAVRWHFSGAVCVDSRTGTSGRFPDPGNIMLRSGSRLFSFFVEVVDGSRLARDVLASSILFSLILSVRSQRKRQCRYQDH